MGLFCLSCGVYSYRNVHKCGTPINALIPLSPQCRQIAMQLNKLSLEPLSAGCFVEPIPEALYDYRINFDIELRYAIPPTLLDLPPKWTYYNQIVGTDFKLSALGYFETFTWIGIQSPQERAQQIANDFSVYLSTLDKFSLMAIRTLYNT